MEIVRGAISPERLARVTRLGSVGAGLCRCQKDADGVIRQRKRMGHAMTGMFLVGQAVLGAYGLPTTSLEDPDALRLVIGLGAATPLFPVIGLALGFILRSTAGAITAALALLWLPLVFNDMLPTWAQENILTLLPGQAVDSFTIAHAVDVPTNSPPLVGVVLVIGWLTLFLGSAQLLLRRRDV